MNYYKIKKYLVIGIILLFCLTDICTAIDFKYDKKTINHNNFSGYIVQFNYTPILKLKNEKFKKIKDFLSIENIKKYKNKLVELHKNAKNEIANLISRINPDFKILSKDFYNFFSGICIKEINKEQIKKIENLSFVKKVIPNYNININLDKSTNLIGANEIWNYHDKNGKNIAGKGIKIAILDTGVNYNHPDLINNYVDGYDFVNNDTDPMDDHGHGTHCAGIALGYGRASNYDISGVAPLADLYSYKVLDNKGEGHLSSVLYAFEEAILDDIDIISISFGNNEELAFPNSTLSIAADNIVDAGIIVVAAAGNDGTNGPISSPACAKKVICVGATDYNDNVASFSSRGPVELENGSFLIKPDIVAPGVNIKSCNLYNGYKTSTGTSMSTPHVAGAAALILQENPDLTPEEVKNILKENALDLGLDKNISGDGRLNISGCIDINQEIIVKSPFRTLEGNRFKVSINDMNDTPIKSFIIFLNPCHLPKIKYGDSIYFKAPLILIPQKSDLKSKIIIINFKRHLFKRYDISVSNKKLITH